jgi:hypothetical protein
MATKRVLLATLFFIALGGFMLHYRIHPVWVPDKATGGLLFSSTNLLSNLFPLVDVVVVTLLFAFRRTAAYGFLLNGLIVIYGTIFMGHFTIATLWGKSAPISAWLVKSLLADILILWGDFLVGKVLYDAHLRG